MIKHFKNKQQAIKSLEIAIQFNCFDIYRNDIDNIIVKDNNLSHYHIQLVSINDFERDFQNFNDEKAPWYYMGNKIQRIILQHPNFIKYIEMFVALEENNFINIMNCYNLKYSNINNSNFIHS